MDLVEQMKMEQSLRAYFAHELDRWCFISDCPCFHVKYMKYWSLKRSICFQVCIYYLCFIFKMSLCSLTLTQGFCSFQFITANFFGFCNRNYIIHFTWCIDKLQTLMKSLLSTDQTLILGDFNVSSSLGQQPLVFGRSVALSSRTSPKCNNHKTSLMKVKMCFIFTLSFSHCCRIHTYAQSLLFL